MRKIFLILAAFLVNSTYSQEVFKVAGSEITLNNGSITRKIKFSHDSLYSYALTGPSGSYNYISKSREFSMQINNDPVNGFNGWDVLSTDAIRDGEAGRGLKIVLRGKKKWDDLQIELNYMLYPDLPLIRKWVKVVNKGTVEYKIEGLNIEDLQTTISQVSANVYHDYGRMKSIGSFCGTWDDPVVVIHDVTRRLGIAVGNEAPGVLKRTAYHSIYDNIEAGLTHPGQDFPFCKWLKSGEEWVSTKTFISIYSNCDNGFDAINGDINAFVTRYMNPRIVQLKEKPVFVYNTWYPFRTFVSDTLIRSVAKAASECGIQEFIIDDGWQINEGGYTSALGWGNNYGDWKVDERKFPGGLKPTFDYIRSLGMKPGLWMSIGSATNDSKVFREHPEWFVINKNNQPGNLHLQVEGSDFHTSCMATGWVDYIKGVILDLVKNYGLAYAKLDFSVVTSAYVNDNSISGCYATDHPYHRDHQESYLIIYERLLKLFDDLHKEAPGLFIDCTFETAGKLQLMDYAIAQHAEGNWLSNFEEPSPTGPLRVRQMAWWRSPALPAGSLVIGNQPMDDPQFEFMVKSLIGTLPIVLGDPRKMTPEKRAMIKKWSAWMQQMQGKYDYMSYRKDLPGFGEPTEGAWDGWMRINFKNRSGGIIGVFRQGAQEDTRKVYLRDLDPIKTYAVRLAPGGKEILRTTGERLMKEGFQAKTDELYDGNIYEVAGE
jgi:alpha-galactosidase